MGTLAHDRRNGQVQRLGRDCLVDVMPKNDSLRIGERLQLPYRSLRPHPTRPHRV